MKTRSIFSPILLSNLDDPDYIRIIESFTKYIESIIGKFNKYIQNNHNNCTKDSYENMFESYDIYNINIDLQESNNRQNPIIRIDIESLVNNNLYFEINIEVLDTKINLSHSKISEKL